MNMTKIFWRLQLYFLFWLFLGVIGLGSVMSIFFIIDTIIILRS
jgi:hypothetical protein